MIGLVLKLYIQRIMGGGGGGGGGVFNATLNNISAISAEDMQRLILTI